MGQMGAHLQLLVLVVGVACIDESALVQQQTRSLERVTGPSNAVITAQAQEENRYNRMQVQQQQRADTEQAVAQQRAQDLAVSMQETCNCEFLMRQLVGLPRRAGKAPKYTAGQTPIDLTMSASNISIGHKTWHEQELHDEARVRGKAQQFARAQREKREANSNRNQLEVMGLLPVETSMTEEQGIQDATFVDEQKYETALERDAQDSQANSEPYPVCSRPPCAPAPPTASPTAAEELGEGPLNAGDQVERSRKEAATAYRAQTAAAKQKAEDSKANSQAEIERSLEQARDEMYESRASTAELFANGSKVASTASSTIPGRAIVTDQEYDSATNIVNDTEKFSQPEAAAAYAAGVKYEADNKAVLMADQDRLNADLAAQQLNLTYSSQEELLRAVAACNCTTKANPLFAAEDMEDASNFQP